MDATMENKLGLPPPYEVRPTNPVSAPMNHNDNPHNPGFVLPRVTVVTQQPRTIVMGPQKMGPGPTGVQCQSCNSQVVTRVEYQPNNRTHIVSAALCVLAGCCCACFIPYCMKSCKTANHYCPNCQAFIGSYAERSL